MIDADRRKSATTCTITCAEPGCNNSIHYQSDDVEVPLYCPKHRTDYGRHSQVRELIKPSEQAVPEKMVIFRCMVKTCHKRKEIPISDWLAKKEVLCECGAKMLYHKDTK